jgi:hypothetical protein
VEGWLMIGGLVLAAVIWIVTGRVKTYEERLEVSSSDPGIAARLIEAEQKRDRSLTREEAARRILDEIRRTTD